MFYMISTGFDGHINAAGMFVGVDGSRQAYASFGGYLCAFDLTKSAASINLCAEPKPSSRYSSAHGLLLRQGSRRRGQTGLPLGAEQLTGTPIFHDDVLFKISASVYEARCWTWPLWTSFCGRRINR